MRIGCSGWNYAHWRNGVFYPPRLASRNWLAFYAAHFDTVEINSTFYRLPRRTAVARWVEETPADFVFAVKVSRYVTHIKRLHDVDQHLPLLYDRLARTLEHLHDGHRHAFEFRHPSWFREETYTVLREHDCALVIGDRPQVHAFQTHELTTDFTFVRFHAGSRGRDGNYSQTELQEWSMRLARWAEQVDVYAYFNNDWEGFAVRNAHDLRAMLLRYARTDAVA